MNEKFFLLPEKKQLAMMNAAYKVFAQNTYKKAPMSEIAEEGQISKALLFHYFHNKLELYMYLWDQAIKLEAEAKVVYKVYETDDFFEILRRGLKAKCMLMRQYPYLSLFSVNSYYEEEAEVKCCVQERLKNVNNEAFDALMKMIRLDKFRKDLDFERIYKQILYASEGMLIQRYRMGDFDVDSFEEEYLQMIELWENIYTERG